MVVRALRTAWGLPRPPVPEGGRARRADVAVVALLVPTTLVEVLVRDDLPWPPWSLASTVVCVVAVLWRTRHPLAALLVGFGAQTAAELVPVLAGAGPGVPYTSAVVLLLAYSLARWGSGRHVLVGVVLLLVASLVREPLYGAGTSDVVGGAAVLALPVVLGAAVRLWAETREREQDEVRHLERERLARDLHDSVAHHVSGIVVQAQAGRAVAARDPGRAAGTLQVVEEAATRALVEMRSIVGVLRADGPVGRAPVGGVADLHRMGAARGGGPAVLVEVGPGLDHLPAAVDAAVYRVVQEAVTNARWHASGASRIEVRVLADAHHVRVEVADDGSGRAGPRGRGSGLGLVGMRERVELLDGRLDAGPRPDGGWTVLAALPGVPR